MKLIREIESIREFEAWSGAVAVIERLDELNAIETLDNMLDDIFPEGCTDTELNDFLWFDTDTIAELIEHCNTDLFSDEEE